jgi:hypothetical protein
MSSRDAGGKGNCTLESLFDWTEDWNGMRE